MSYDKTIQDMHGVEFVADYSPSGLLQYHVRLVDHPEIDSLVPANWPLFDKIFRDRGLDPRLWQTTLDQLREDWDRPKQVCQHCGMPTVFVSRVCGYCQEAQKKLSKMVELEGK